MAEDASRRRMLTVLAGVSVAGLGAAAIPAARLAAAPASGASSESPWVPVAKLADLPDGAPTRVKVIADRIDGFTTDRQQPLGQVWLTRKGDQVTALSASCPHLGCTVDMSPDRTQFFCPCHASTFRFDGERTPGVPNKSLRSMDPIPVRVTQAKVVEVQWQRFTPGVEAREVVG
jgi:cytochrome b6-f complex iron-sulfur subunit/menaquinol-cytochrome c reductase iron-sulfur subunit